MNFRYCWTGTFCDVASALPRDVRILSLYRNPNVGQEAVAFIRLLTIHQRACLDCSGSYHKREARMREAELV
jgi:hypothetical protein